MELIRSNAGIYGTSRKTDQRDFFVGRKKKKKDCTFQFIQKPLGNKITQQPRVTTAKISFFFKQKCHGVLANIGLLPEIFHSLQNITVKLLLRYW